MNMKYALFISKRWKNKWEVHNLGWWDQVRFRFAKTHISIDFGYSRSDPSCVIYFKVFKGKFYIMRIIK